MPMIPDQSKTAGVALALALALLPPLPAVAGGAEPPLPAWDELSQAQRDALVAPLRQRWNDHPEKRERMLAHAERWQQMGPEQRERARRGADRWRQMDPAKREALRALYARLQVLPEAERAALRQQWKTMTPEQRRAWVEANPAPRRSEPPPSTD